MIHAILLMLVMIGSVGCILMGYSALARLVEGIDDSRKEHTIVSFEWGHQWNATRDGGSTCIPIHIVAEAQYCPECA